MSRFEIDIELHVEVSQSLVEAVEGAAIATLNHQSAQPSSALTILLTDDDRLRQLNRDFLGYDEPTDVLSFPTGDNVRGAESYPAP